MEGNGGGRMGGSVCKLTDRIHRRGTGGQRG